MKNIIACMAIATALTGAIPEASATVPDFIPIQGVLTDNDGNTIDGDVPVLFELFAGETGGAALWSELHNGTTTPVACDHGFFSLYLGEITSLDFDALVQYPELWLSITVGLDAAMDRVRLATVPFAFDGRADATQEPSHLLHAADRDQLDAIFVGDGLDLLSGAKPHQVPDRLGNHDLELGRDGDGRHAVLRSMA